jgi:hypothetical protein
MKRKKPSLHFIKRLREAIAALESALAMRPGEGYDDLVLLQNELRQMLAKAEGRNA